LSAAFLSTSEPHASAAADSIGTAKGAKKGPCPGVPTGAGLPASIDALRAFPMDWRAAAKRSSDEASDDDKEKRGGGMDDDGDEEDEGAVEVAGNGGSWGTTKLT